MEENIVKQESVMVYLVKSVHLAILKKKTYNNEKSLK